jgi:RNA polymerase sigma-70 factor, ECF subfamily
MDHDLREQAEFVGQITRHQSALRAYIIALMPGMDGVSDVLQEVNVILWEKRATFRAGTNFRAWACAIARLEVKVHRRKMIRHDMRLLDEDLAEELAVHCAAGTGEVDERLRALEKCLGRLNEKERGLIEQRYFSKTSLEEFALRCDRPAESLRVSLFRIRAGLKKCITGEITLNRVRA